MTNGTERGQQEDFVKNTEKWENSHRKMEKGNWMIPPWNSLGKFLVNRENGLIIGTKITMLNILSK